MRGRKTSKAEKVLPLRPITYRRVTYKRFQAELINDALRWVRGPSRAGVPLARRLGLIPNRPLEWWTVPRAHQRVQSPVGVYPHPLYYTTAFVNVRPWTPPQLNSDYPGVTAYGLDEESYEP